MVIQEDPELTSLKEVYSQIQKIFLREKTKAWLSNDYTLVK